MSVFLSDSGKSGFIMITPLPLYIPNFVVRVQQVFQIKLYISRNSGKSGFIMITPLPLYIPNFVVRVQQVFQIKLYISRTQML